MKYESKRFDERWGTQQAEARREVTSTILSNDTSDQNLGGYGKYWVDPHSGEMHVASGTPWDQYQWVPQHNPSVTTDIQIAPDLRSELELLRASLSTCLICGLTDVFVLCSLCRETVKEARQAMLDRMVESINSMSQ
jgi:hypothetical protein